MIVTNRAKVKIMASSEKKPSEYLFPVFLLAIPTADGMQALW